MHDAWPWHHRWGGHIYSTKNTRRPGPQTQQEDGGASVIDRSSSPVGTTAAPDQRQREQLQSLCAAKIMKKLAGSRGRAHWRMDLAWELAIHICCMHANHDFLVTAILYYIVLHQVITLLLNLNYVPLATRSGSTQDTCMLVHLFILKLWTVRDDIDSL